MSLRRSYSTKEDSPRKELLILKHHFNKARDELKKLHFHLNFYTKENERLKFELGIFRDENHWLKNELLERDEKLKQYDEDQEQEDKAEDDEVFEVPVIRPPSEKTIPLSVWKERRSSDMSWAASERNSYAEDPVISSDGNNNVVNRNNLVENVNIPLRNGNTLNNSVAIMNNASKKRPDSMTERAGLAIVLKTGAQVHDNVTSYADSQSPADVITIKDVSNNENNRRIIQRETQELNIEQDELLNVEFFSTYL